MRGGEHDDENRKMCCVWYVQKDKILRFFEAGKKEQTHKKKKNTIEYTMNDEE